MRPRLLVGMGFVVLGALALFVALSATRNADKATTDARPEDRETARAEFPEATAGSSEGSQKEKVAVAPEVQVRGRVYDQDTREFVAGVAVRATSREEDTGDPKEVLTNSRGRYVLTGLDEGQYIVSVRAQSPYLFLAGEDEVAVTIRAGDPPLRVDFPLSKGLVVTGKVIFEDGEAAPGAVVIGRQTRFGVLGLEEERESIEADSEGRFEVGAFREGADLFLMAHSADATSAWVGPVNIQADTVTKRVDGIVLRLQPGSRIEGTAITTSAFLLPYAKVEARRVDARDAPYRVSADEEGRFSLTGILAGTYDLRAIPQDLKFTNESSATRTEVAAGQSVYGLQVLFDDGDHLAIGGRITNDSHEPVPEALVTAEADTNYTVLSDAEGNYRIPYLRDSLFEVTVNHPDYAEGRQEVWANSAGVDFILQRFGLVDVQVLDQDTKTPIREFRISMAAGHGISKSEIDVRDPEGRHRLDIEGTFFDRMLAQKSPIESVLEIRAEAEGFQPDTKTLTFAELLGTDKELLFLLSSEVSTLAGTVVNEDGEPVGGAEILSGDFGRTLGVSIPVLARSNEEGRFEIRPFDEEIDALSARHPAYAFGRTLVLGDRDITIVLRRGGTVLGTVREDGEPVTRTQVMLSSGTSTPLGDQTLWAFTDGAGRYTFTDVQTGPARIGVGPHWKGVKVAAGTTAIVDFDIVTEGLSEISGTVTIHGEAPKRGSVQVILGPETNLGKQKTFSRYSMIDGQGSYRIDNVPSGTGLLYFEADAADSEHYIRRLRVTIGENESVVADVEMSDVYTLRGTVIGDFRLGKILVFAGEIDVTDWFESLPDRTAEGVLRTMYDPLAPGNASFDDRQGAFEILNLEVGSYTLAIFVLPQGVDFSEFYITSRPVRIEANDTNYVEIVLP